MEIRSLIPNAMKSHLRTFVRALKMSVGLLRPNIVKSTGKLSVHGSGNTHTFVVAVGPSFDQNRPDAMMTCRMGYCNAFEQLGIPYLIVDVNDVRKVLPSLKNPFCMIFGGDYAFMSRHVMQILRRYPKFVWVHPWFKDSDEFFHAHGLDSYIWTLSKKDCRRILDSEPSFVFTATVETGLRFFEEWERNGVRLLSLPLACDTSLYNPCAPYREEFAGIRMAFVGGYWESKGRQIDMYLRKFEDDLVIYGYTRWPYRGYRGQLSREAEPSLYQQALVSPTINEPTVKLLHGQINERVFKVLGSGGMTVVDAIPAYRQLFTEEELIVPKSEFEFHDVVSELLVNDSLREQYSRRGYEAIVSRHTYIHRAKIILQQLGITIGRSGDDAY